MNEMKYYPCGFSGDYFLSVKESIISHLEYLENGYIQLIECNKEEKSMKVMEKQENDKDINHCSGNSRDGEKGHVIIEEGNRPLLE